MKKLLLATVASLALSLPAMAQSQNMDQSQQPGSQNQTQEQQPQDQSNLNGQQSQDQNNLNNQQQAQNTIDPSQLDTQQIRQIQQALNKQGFDAGHVDGKWGSGTAKALQDFQKQKQMQANGKLDQQTLQALGVNMTAQQNNQGNGVSPQQPSSATTGQGSSENEQQPGQNGSPSDQNGSQQSPSGQQNQQNQQ